MKQRDIVLVFAATVALLCAAAYAAGRWIAPPAEVGSRGRPAWTPPAAATAPTSAVTLTAFARPAASPSPGRTAPAPAPTTTLAPAGRLTPTAMLTSTATFTPTLEPPSAFAFELAQEVRHSSGDCPGAYILGRVTDAQGRPLANVRLRLADEYGNQQTQVSKSGAGEAGRYDFPLFGPPRRFYLSVVDAQGRRLSPEVEIPHGVGLAAQATCHWADWRRR